MSFDKLAGIYVFCANYHEGQNSRLYRIMSRIASRDIRLTDSAWAQIEASPTLNEMENWDWFEARQVYQTLVQNHAS